MTVPAVHTKCSRLIARAKTFWDVVTYFIIRKKRGNIRHRHPVAEKVLIPVGSKLLNVIQELISLL